MNFEVGGALDDYAKFRDRSVPAPTARGARAIEEVLHGGLRSGVLQPPHRVLRRLSSERHLEIETAAKARRYG